MAIFKHFSKVIAAGIVFLTSLAASPVLAQGGPSFSQVFTPSTIGPGSESTLTYTIDNSLGIIPVTDLAFTNVLTTVPGDVDIATPSNATTTCQGMGGASLGTVIAPDGGGTISFFNGQIGAGIICTVSVDVTAGTAGVHTNPIVTLTSSAGPIGSSPADLTVSTALPAFLLSAAPSTINLGEISTLTFTADNAANASVVGNLDFSTSLPIGLEIANPSNAATTCVSASLPDTDLTAVPGTSTITLNADGNTIIPGFEVLGAGATCTTTVDVLSTGAGTFNIVAPFLLADFIDAGGASTTLQVDVAQLNIAKSFITNPAIPGGQIDLEFSIDNLNRNFSATGVGFTDDLDAVVSGLEYASLVSNDCGGSVGGVGTGFLTFSGGTIAPEGSCTIRVTLDVPTAGAGDYPNTTSAVTAMIDGSPETGNMATANLTIADATVTPPILAISIPDGNPSDTVAASFTLTNTASLALTDGAFDLQLTPPLPFPPGTSLPPSPDPACGGGSVVANYFPDIDQQGLRLTGASLAAAGSAGDSCTFSVDIVLAADLAPGDYSFTSTAPTATIDSGTRTGIPASDTMTVGSDLNMSLSKVFLGAGVPGDTVDLQFDISRSSDSPDVTAFSFTDDLDAMLTGTTLASIESDTCGGSATGTGTISYSGGSLTGSTLECTIVARINVPAGAAIGDYLNTTSALSATPSGGVAEDFLAASDTLTVTGMNFTKEFLTDPVLAGGTTTLRFSIENLHPTDDATITFFTDNIQQELTGLAASGPPTFNDCGSSVSGTTFLIATGGSVTSGSTCNIEVPILVPVSAAAGTYNNLTSSLAATQGGAVTVDPAQDTLTVITDPILFIKEFTNDPVRQGEDATLVFTITNQTGSAATSLSFADDLDVMLSNSVFASENSNSCGSTTTGLGTGTFGSGSFGLAAGATCTISIEVGTDALATIGTHANVTTDISGTVAGGPVPAGVNATDSLSVDSSIDVTFTKTFASSSVSPGDTVTLTFDLTNATAGALSGLRFSDDLDAMLTGATATTVPSNPCGGTSTGSGTGTGFLAFTEIDLAASDGSCSFDVTVQIPADALGDTYDNTTSNLNDGGSDIAAPATDSITVATAADIEVTKDDGITAITAGGTVVYTIGITNNGPMDDPSASLTDTFPGGLSCTYTSVASGGASGNTSGSGNISDASLNLPVGASVTYTATCAVDYAFTGTLSNTATGATSLSVDLVPGNDSATDGNTVVSAPDDLTFSKAFGTDPIDQGGVSTLTFSIGNPNADISVGNIAFSDTFPTGMVVAPTPATNTTCGGTVTAVAGASTMTFSGGSLGLGGACVVEVDVRGINSGALFNTSSDLSSDLPTDTSAANATLNVTAAPAPGFAKVFGTNPIDQGGVSTLTFTIDNTGNLIEASTLAFTDTFPTGMEVAPTPNDATTCGGTVSATAGDGSFSFSGGTVAAGASCTVSVDVRSLVSGPLVNTSGDLSSSLDTDASGATDTLTVNAAPAPGFAKVFAPDAIDQGDISTLTFTIDNTGNLIEASSLAFSDTFPAGLVVAPTPNDATTCGGTVSATAGDGSFSFSGGTVAEGASCTVSVDVRGLVSGPLVNTSSDLSSSLDTDAAAATDTLTVNSAAAPGFGKVFSPDRIFQGGISTLTFTIDNTGNLIEAATLAFTDTFPGGMVVAPTPNTSNTCGGTFTATAGASSVDLADGVVAEGTSCQLSVDVRGLVSGALVNPSVTLTSSLDDDATSSSATLTVESAPAPGFTKAFSPDTIDQGGISTLTFTIDNSASLIEATLLAFSDTFPTGMIVAPTPNEATTCAGTVSATAGDGSFSFADGIVAEGASCTVSVDVRGILPGALDNISSDLSSSLDSDAVAASATLTVNAAAAPGFTKSFATSPINQGETTTLTFAIDNSANLIEATSLAFTDTFPAGMIVSAAPNITSDCGGTFTATAGTDSAELTGGTVAEGATCSVEVDVQAVLSGDLVNLTGDLTSSIATASGATDTLTVNALPLETSLAFTPSTIEQFQTSTMTIALRNVAVIEATSISVTDNLPGIEIAALPNASTSCTGGTLTATAGATSLTYTGGALAAGGNCLISVDVTGSTVGDAANTTDGITSSLGTSLEASATLTIDPASTGSVTFDFVSDTDGTFSSSSLTAALTLDVEVNGGTGSSGAVSIAAGTYDATLSAPVGVVMTDITCDDSNSTGEPATGAVALDIAVGELVTCTVTAQSSVQKTVDTINAFLTKRADLILSTEPRRTRRINRVKNGIGGSTKVAFATGDLESFLPFTAQIGTDTYSFSTSLTEARQAAASIRLAHGSTKSIEHIPNYRFDAWLEAHYKKFNAGTASEGYFATIFAGADYLVNDKVLIGAMLSVDDMKDVDDAAGSTTSGTGWMFGPYVTARLAPNLYFDARIAGGRSNNNVSPFNTYVDQFSTTRWLAQASLSGEFQSGKWTISPNATLAYFTETQDSYIDSVGATIPSQTIELGQLKIGPTFNTQFVGDGGTVYSPYFSVDAIYNLGRTSGVTITNPDSPSTEGWRGRLKAGVDMVSENGVTLGFGATYDGIGRSDFEVWGLTFDLNIPLYKPIAQ